ncbi:MAG: hypothetical protein AAGE65_06960 [Planctomycetota bacterium]
MTRYLPSVTLIAAGAALLAALTVLSGCNIGEWIPVETPRHMQQEVGVPHKIKLSQVDELRAEYVAAGEAEAAELTRGLQALDGNAAEAAFWRDALAGFTDIGVQYGTVAIGEAAIPGGSLLSSLLVGVGGVLLGRQTRKQAAEKVITEAQAEFEKRLKRETDAAWDESGRETERKIVTGQALNTSGLAVRAVE